MGTFTSKKGSQTSSTCEPRTRGVTTRAGVLGGSHDPGPSSSSDQRAENGLKGSFGWVLFWGPPLKFNSKAN